MKKFRITRTILAAALAGSLAAPAAYAEETLQTETEVQAQPEALPSSGEASFWVKLESTNIPELQMYSALKYAASFLTDGEKAKVDMSVESEEDTLLSGSAYIKDGILYLSAPELSDTVFTLDLAEYGRMLTESAETAVPEQKLPSVNPFDITGPQIQAEESGSQILDLLGGMDYQALEERYLKYCQKSLEELQDSVVTEDYGEMKFEIDGEYVVCQGTAVTIPKEAAVRLLDATVDFALRDEECRSVLDGLFPGKLDTKEEEHQFQENVYDYFDENMKDVSYIEYDTPQGETAAWYLSIGEEGSDDYALISKVNEGGETIGENFQFQYSAAEKGEQSAFLFRRSADHQDSVTTMNLSVQLQTGTPAASEEETGSLANHGADWTSTFDETTGDFTVSCSLRQDDKSMGDLTSYGNVEQEEGKLNVKIDTLTWMSGGKYVTLSGGLYGGQLLTGVAPDKEPEKTMDLLGASEEELNAEGLSMSQKLQMIVMQYLMNQGGLTGEQ